MTQRHHYEARTRWTGNSGQGTTAYRAYERSHETAAAGRPDIAGSSDPAFRGDSQRWNPELLLVAALSQCHLLAYLHQCAVAGVVVTAYVDEASGTMTEADDGGGQFEEVVLRPVVTVRSADMVERAEELHHRASQLCFITRSVNFPVRHDPRVEVQQESSSVAG
jgi:organic hydroperoxide reductase OsmC/OhrA